MITLKKLKVKNGCQHYDTVMEFTTGITIVVGKNGCGKSNFTHTLLYFSLTGETPPKKQIKKELLAWTASSGYTALYFNYNGREYELIRNLHNSAVSLRSVDNIEPKVALQQSEANDRVFEMLGMSASTLYKTCFSAQKKLTDVIEMTHSERMTYFQQLFETERAEKLRGMLLDYQNKLPNYVDRLVAIKETEERIAQLQESRVKVDELLTAYKASYEEHTKAAPTYEAILAKPSQTQLAHSIALVQAKVDDATAKYNSFCANILTAPVAPTRELATDALDKVRKKQQFLHLQKDVATQTAEVDKWKSVEQEKAPVKPTEPAFPEDQEISSLTALYRLAKEGVCPTCKRPHVLTRSVEDITVELTTLKKAVEDRKLSYNREMTDYTSKVGAYTVKLNNFNLAKNRLNTAKLQIQPLINEGLDNFDEAEVAEIQKEWTAYYTATSEYNRLISYGQSLKDTLTTAQANLANAQSQPFSTAEEIDAAVKFKQQIEQLRTELSNINSNISAIDAEIKAETRRLTEYKSEQEKRSSVITTLEKFENARKLLHKDNLQKRVMQTALGALNAIIDAYLTHFGKDYTAWIDADFEFRASKPTNPDFRAGLLSGGEQMALAMAYRLAIAEVKGSNLPLIVLDEPTEGLDNEALRGLIEVLKIARTYAEKGLYIIIPTHSPEMEAAKSQVIDMEELAQC